MITKELIELKVIVKRILIRNFNARDNDSILYDLIWQLQIKNIKTLPYAIFINKLRRGDLFQPKSILRARQRIQELHPNTRGILYYERRNMQGEAKEILEKYKRII